MGSLKCTLCCGESFDTAHELRSHLQNVLDNLHCSSCSHKCSSIQELLDHYALYCNSTEESIKKCKFSTQQSPVEPRQSFKKEVIPEKHQGSLAQDIVDDRKSCDSVCVKNCSSTVFVEQANDILKEDVPDVCGNKYSSTYKDHTSHSAENNLSNDFTNPVPSIIATNGSCIVQNHTPDVVGNPASDDFQNHTLNTVQNPDCGITKNHTNGAAENQTFNVIETKSDCEASNVVECHNIFENHSDEIVVDNDIFQNSSSETSGEMSANEISVINDSPQVRTVNTSEAPVEVENLVYQCSCGMYFASLVDHLMTYHCGEEVIVKGELDKLETIEEVKVDERGARSEASHGVIPQISHQVKRRPRRDEPQVVICDRENQDDDEEGKMNKTAHTPLTSSQIDQLDGKVEECLDKDGRLYWRKLVRVEKFWSKKDEEKAAQMRCKKKNYETVRDVPVGSVSINSKDEAVSESQTGSPKKLYQCSKCMTTFQTMFHFRYHVCCVSKKGPPSTCNLCGHESTSAKELKAHWRMHQRQRRAAATALWEMQAGEVVHTKGKTEEVEDAELQCDRCGKMYKKSEVLIHVAMHDEQPPYKCPKCELSYDSQDKLARHARSHREQKNHSCLFCEKTFTDSNAFKLHMRSHTGEKPFECHFCSKKFSRPYERMKHERIHTGERPHVCDICGKTFRVSYCLTLHKRTHSGDRPYSCETCGKRFKAHSAFKHHVQIHSEARNYKCPFCPKAFKTMVHLAGHKKTHTKPFLCTECNRRFASLYSVKAHMESHKTGENRFRYRCFVCGASYARAFALHAHMRTHGTCYPPEDVAEVLEIQEEEPKKEDNELELKEVCDSKENDDKNAYQEGEMRADGDL